MGNATGTENRHVGERKLTIVAQGCDLKSVLVQAAKALQECHWDVDLQGKEPAYLLHRDAGANVTIAELAQWDTARKRAVRWPAREERLAEARRAGDAAGIGGTREDRPAAGASCKTRRRGADAHLLPGRSARFPMSETMMNCAGRQRLRESVHTYAGANAELAYEGMGSIEFPARRRGSTRPYLRILTMVWMKSARRTRSGCGSRPARPRRDGWDAFRPSFRRRRAPVFRDCSQNRNADR
jgi:hypothetical protein